MEFLHMICVINNQMERIALWPQRHSTYDGGKEKVWKMTRCDDMSEQQWKYYVITSAFFTLCFVADRIFLDLYNDQFLGSFINEHSNI